MRRATPGGRARRRAAFEPRGRPSGPGGRTEDAPCLGGARRRASSRSADTARECTRTPPRASPPARACAASRPERAERNAVARGLTSERSPAPASWDFVARALTFRAGAQKDLPKKAREIM